MYLKRRYPAMGDIKYKTNDSFGWKPGGTIARYKCNIQLIIYHDSGRGAWTFTSIAEGAFCRTATVQCQVSPTRCFTWAHAAVAVSQRLPPTCQPITRPILSSFSLSLSLSYRLLNTHATNQANLLIAWHLYDSYKTMNRLGFECCGGTRPADRTNGCVAALNAGISCLRCLRG